MDKKIILISGCKRCGKDTVANRLMERIPNSAKFSFADPLREICSIAFGFSPEHYGDDLKEVVVPEWNMSPRDALIKVGTELFRKQVDPDIWVKATINRIKNSSAEYIFITDARFHNELQMVKEAFPNHHTFLIIRPDVIPKNGIEGAHVTEHFGILQSIERSYMFDGVFINHNLDHVESCVQQMYEMITHS
jgi:hypothetical protein